MDSPGRYQRHTLIDWFSQADVKNARICVVGAGAVGNEVLKCLALLGAGTIDVYDFDRIEALDYAIAHDDGQGGQDLTQADVILVGVSRTSKTPTCIYLAHRGVRAANVPLVPGRPPPTELFELKNTLIVGLMTSPDRLIQIRRNRLLSLKENRESDYIDTDAVRSEIIAARRLFEKMGWPIIDVTRRSVEETAAAIINLLSGGRGQVEVLG